MPEETEHDPKTVHLVPLPNGATWLRIPDGTIARLGWKESDKVLVVATRDGFLVRRA